MAIDSDEAFPLASKEENISEKNTDDPIDAIVPFPDQIHPIKIMFIFCNTEAEIFKSIKRFLYNLSFKMDIIVYEELLAGASLEEIIQHMDHVDVIIILPSVNFDEDDFRRSSKMYTHIRECAENGVRIWPVLLNHYLYEKSDFYLDYGMFFSLYDYLSATQYERYTHIARRISHEVDYMLADRYTHLGDTYMQQLRIPQALAVYDRALTYVENYPGAMLGKGCAFREQRNLVESEKYFKKTILLTPKIFNDLTQISCKIIKLRLDYYRGCALIEQKDFDKALQIFKSIYLHRDISLDRTALPIKKPLAEIYAQAYCGEGDVLMALVDVQQLPEDYERAYTSYKKAYEIQINCVTYLLKMGDVQMKLGKKYHNRLYYEQAMLHYKYAVNRFSDNSLVYSRYGDVLAALQQYEDALNAYDHALQLEKFQKPLLYEKKGRILLELHRNEDALYVFDDALALDSDNAFCYDGKGAALVALDRYQEALQAYEQARQYNVHLNGLAIRTLGVLVELIEEEYTFDHVTQAEAYIQKVSLFYQGVSNHSDSLYRNAIYCAQGRISFAQKNMGYAEIAYSEAINSASDQADGYLGIIRIYIEYNDYLKASGARLHAVNKLILKTSEAERCLVFGDYFECFAGEIGSEIYYSNLQQACKYYKRAIYLYPRKFKRAITYERLGKVYKSLGWEEEALKALSNALYLDDRLIECYFLQGECCAKLKRYREAYSFFSKAIDSGFDNISVRILLGDVLFKMGCYLDAINKFKEVINKIKSHFYDHYDEDIRNTEIAYAYGGMGATFYALDQEEVAIKAFLKASEYKADIFEYPRYLHPLKAIHSAIEVRIRNHPYDAVSYLRKGDILFALKQYKESCVSYMEALQSDKLQLSQRVYANGQRELVDKLYVEHQKTIALNSDAATNTPSKYRDGLFKKLFTR